MYDKNKSNKGKSGKKRNNRNSKRENYKTKTGDREIKSKEERYDEEALRGKTSASNDSGWYRADSALMQSAASIPFNNTLGLPFNMTDGSTDTDAEIIPGIMCFSTVPTPGTCGSWDDPVNVAVRDLYAEIRAMNSGSKNYDPANLGMYLQVYDSCATYYAWMVRLYGTMRATIEQNRYTPENLIQVMGADYNSLAANMANFHAYLLTYADRLNWMRVPSKWHVIERHMWIYSNVFRDSPSNRCQFYLFNPFAFWKYTLDLEPSATGLFLHRPGASEATYEEITKFGTDLLNSIRNDQDFALISGDIRKAYGDKVFTLPAISKDYMVTPTYDPEVLVQIHNATVSQQFFGTEESEDDVTIPGWSIKEDMSETTNVGAITLDAPFTCGFTAGPNSSAVVKAKRNNCALLLKNVVDVPIDNPNSTLVCIATRLQFSVTYEGERNLALHSYGTEIIVRANYYTRQADGSLSKSVYTGDNAYEEVFSERPLMRYVAYDVQENANGGLNLNKRVRIEGPMDNYACIDKETLYNIHRAALLGMYEMTV